VIAEIVQHRGRMPGHLGDDLSPPGPPRKLQWS
jgi:hypothetical protein